MPSELGPFEPTAPWQPGAEYLTINPSADTGLHDDAIVYLNLEVTSGETYDPGCFIIGDGEAQLRWFAGDQQLRWLGYDANLRWDAVIRLGTGQC